MGTPPPPYEVEPHPHAYSASPSGSSAPVPAPIPRRPVASSILDSKTPFPASAPAPAPGPSGLWLGSDPRSSSTQSLLPEDAYAPSASLSASSAADARGRRTLLVIYLHGFLGNDQSFRSFPAHVHALLSDMLVDSHVIHSKIYPRYKTYRAVDVARDNFSTWLAPHESPTTDVILVGHSMGGILAADIILMPNYSPYGQQSLKHRILGHVSLDCPFLGLHPGIIVSGISSLFKPAPQPQDPGPDNSSTYHLDALNDHGAPIASPGSSSTLNLTPSQSPRPGYPSSIASSSLSGPSASGPADQFFNQPFFNDAAFREQPFVRRMLHFASKYRSEGLIQAAAKHVVSYLEFGSCLADPSGLESRYCRLRALEDVDELKPFGPGRDPRGPTTRVRFVNYYTLCTGRPKTPKPGTPDPESHKGAEVDAETDGSFKRESLDNETPALEKSSFGLASSSLIQAAQDEKDQHKTSIDSPRPSITIEDHDRNAKAPEAPRPKDTMDPDAVSLCSDMDEMYLLEPTPMEEVDPTPMSDEPIRTDKPAPSNEPTPSEPRDSITMHTRASTDQDFELDLTPVPDEPVRPALPDLDLYGDKDARKQAEREAKRLQRAYDQAVKDRAKAIREREKIIDKRRKKAQKAVEKLEKDALKEAERLKKALKESEHEESQAVKEQRRLEQEALRMEAERQRMQQPDNQSTPAPTPAPAPALTPTPMPALTPTHTLTDRTIASSSFSAASSSASAAVPEAKPRKLRRFCNLPDGVPTAGGGTARDHTWVDIFMTDVDEVGAHCGLFMAGPHYERLVGDVGSRIVGWVQEDMTRRAILEMGEVQ